MAQLLDLDDVKNCCCQTRLLETQIATLEILDFFAITDHKSTQSAILQKALKGTGQWFLNSDEFLTWVSGAKQTLYCPGIRGTGKTYLTAMAVDELRQGYQHDPKVGIAYLYLDDITTAIDHRDGWKKEVFGNLLRQFLEYGTANPDISLVRDLRERHAAHETRPSCAEVLEALRTVMANRYSKTYIFVDGLNWLTHATHVGYPGELFKELFSIQDAFGTNLLFTSRPIPVVAKHLAGVPTLEIRTMEQDIRLYLDAVTPKLPGCIARNEEFLKEIATTITKKAAGM